MITTIMMIDPHTAYLLKLMGGMMGFAILHYLAFGPTKMKKVRVIRKHRAKIKSDTQDFINSMDHHRK
jgi:hypothetical protein